MANVLKLEKKLQVIHMLVEGVSLRSVERVTGVQKKTAMKLMVKFGQACREFPDKKIWRPRTQSPGMRRTVDVRFEKAGSVA